MEICEQQKIAADVRRPFSEALWSLYYNVYLISNENDDKSRESESLSWQTIVQTRVQCFYEL